MNRARLLAYATALSAIAGWSLLAPLPAQAQLGSLIVTVTSPADGPGDRATFTFTGTSVSWIGYRGPQTGTGLKNPASAGASIVVDAFDVTP